MTRRTGQISCSTTTSPGRGAAEADRSRWPSTPRKLAEAEAAGLSATALPPAGTKARRKPSSARRSRSRADRATRSTGSTSGLDSDRDAARDRGGRGCRRGRRASSRPSSIAREPFAEIAALATDCFRQLVAAPHVVVRVNDALHETRAASSSTRSPAPRGFEGRLVVHRRARASRPATAASNGPTAASSATAPQPTAAIAEAVAPLRRGAQRADAASRNSGDDANE